MHDTDSITKDYMKDAATFADAFNFLLYNGEPVIQPGQLREMDTTMLALPFGEDGVTVPEQKSRDVLKFLTAKADDNAAYCILSIENQTDGIMPCRFGICYMIPCSIPIRWKRQENHTSKRKIMGHMRSFYPAFIKTSICCR